MRSPEKENEVEKEKVKCVSEARRNEEDYDDARVCKDFRIENYKTTPA